MLSLLRISFDIIGISETWMPEPNDLIQMEDYKYYKLICNGQKKKTEKKVVKGCTLRMTDITELERILVFIMKTEWNHF